MIAFLPDAILFDSRSWVKGVALLVDEQGVVIGSAFPDELPPECPLEVFEGETWVPAPILAHTHLESSDPPSSMWPKAPFSDWLHSLLAWRDANPVSAMEEAHAIHAELTQLGCGMALAHVAFPPKENWLEWSSSLEGCLLLPALELFAPEERHAQKVISLLRELPLADSGFVSLHAPYSVHPTLAKHIFTEAKQSGFRVSIHLGEHEEELECLRGEANRLNQLFQSRGLSASMGGGSPLEWLESVGGLCSDTLAIHGGELTQGDLESLHANGAAHVWCPGAHSYFNRPQPIFDGTSLPLPALGCDSKASNTCLDPLFELREARRFVSASPQDWWDALTKTGAVALGVDNKLGVLHRGFEARVLRLASVAVASSAHELCDALSSQAWPVLGVGKMLCK